MNIDIFLAKLADALDEENCLKLGQPLSELEGWDSLGVLSLLDLLEHEGVNASLAEVGNAQTVDDIIKIASEILDGDSDS